MSAKTKIVVLHMKEVVYTIIFLILAIIMAVLLYVMFGQKKDESKTTASSSLYIPGVYTSSIHLNDNTFDMEVTVDADRIKQIRLVNLSETTDAAFPLLSPSLENIADQILSSQSLEGITCPQENKYTSQLLFSAVSNALSRAKAAEG